MANPLTKGLPRTYSPAERWLLENPKFLEQMRGAGASPYNRMGGGFSVAENGSLPSLSTGIAEVAGAGANAAARAMPYVAGMTIPTPIGLDPAEGIHQKIDAQGAVLGGPQISNEEMQAIIAQLQGGPSPAPRLEMYDAMDSKMGGMPAMRRANFQGGQMPGAGPQGGISPQESQQAVQEAKRIRLMGGGLPDANYNVYGAESDEDAERAAGAADYLDRGKKKNLKYKGKKTRKYSQD